MKVAIYVRYSSDNEQDINGQIKNKRSNSSEKLNRRDIIIKDELLLIISCGN